MHARPSAAAVPMLIAVIAVAGCGLRPADSHLAHREVRHRRSHGAPGKHLPPPPPLRPPLVVGMSWIGARKGWALEAVPCGSRLCPRIAATADGGRTWRALPAPPGHIDQNGGPGLNQIRFATARVGYLFGPVLYQTTDGGLTWRRVPGPHVEALATAGGMVIRVVYDHSGCPGPCTRMVQEAAAGSGRWRTLLRIASPLPGSRAAWSDVITQGRSVIYVPVYGDLAAGVGTQHTFIFRSTDGGASWRRLPDPCPGTGMATHDAAGLATAASGFVAALCVSRSGGGGRVFVVASHDHGSTWGPPRPVPPSGYVGLIATAGRDRLVVASGLTSGSGPFTSRLLVSADGGRHWRIVVAHASQLNPLAPAVGAVGFPARRAGWWISDPHTIWLSRDGGFTWRQIPPPS